MDIKIAPLREDEIDHFVDIYWAAFNPPEVNMVVPMIYPLGLQSNTRERFRNRFRKTVTGDPNNTSFCAKDSSTGEVIGVAWWAKVDSPPRNQQELDERYEEARAGRDAGVEVEGMNRALETAFFKAAFYSEAEIMGKQPYATLKLLAVRPDYARKGVGTILLKRWLEEVDLLDLPSFIQAGVQAKPLYQRHGFTVVAEVPCNALDYGGRSDGRHWNMTRPARSRQKGP